MPVPASAISVPCVRIACATDSAIASCCARKRKPGSARASVPPSPKIAASSVSGAAGDPESSAWAVRSWTSSISVCRFPWARRAPRQPPSRLRRARRERGANRARLFVERLVRPRDARLVGVVVLAPLPFQARDRLHPQLVERAQVVDRGLAAGGLLQRGLIRARDVDLLLVDAVLALGGVDALFGFLVAELDDLDALHVPAHRIEMIDRVEEAVDRAGARGVRADVGVGLGDEAALLGGSRRGDGANQRRGEENEQRAQHGRSRKNVGRGMGNATAVRGRRSRQTNGRRARHRWARHPPRGWRTRDSGPLRW